MNEVRQMCVTDLKAMLDATAPFEFVDVRTEAERAIASIEGARLLDQAYHDELMGKARSTPLVFHCHHGGRSQQAAEYFRHHGFTNVSNVVGGIDAWSTEIDPSVPRY